MKIIGVIALLGAMAFANNALAWNSHGHMVIAAVAWDQLKPTARAEILRLLKLNPDYESWIAGVTENLEETVFLRAATWPDNIKKEANYQDDPRSGPDASRNIGYADHLRHRYWHFVDKPFSTDGTTLPPVATPNVATQITFFRQVIADRGAPDDVRSYDLTWLIHMVGDIHQPLHAVTRYTAADPDGDKEGMKVVVCDPACNSSLHVLWSDALGSTIDVAPVIRQAAALPPAPADAAAITDTGIWVQEMIEIAKTDIYAPPIGNGNGPYQLTPAYKANVIAVDSLLAAVAGARLAVILNQAFPE